jgi:hypothetical protein
VGTVSGVASLRRTNMVTALVRTRLATLDAREWQLKFHHDRQMAAAIAGITA